MKHLEQQIQEVVETCEEFVLILNTEGIIVHSSQNWIDYCQKQQLPHALWKIGKNYSNCLKGMKKFNELQCLEDILNGIEEEVIQLSLLHAKEKTDYLSVKYQQFSLNNHSKGIILYKQVLTNMSAVNFFNTELIFESITDAFFLLDHQMRFYYLNTESEKVLRRKKEEIIGRNIWSCFPQAIGTEFHSNYVRAMQDRVTIQFEEYYSPLDSWFSVKVYPISDGGLAVYYRKIHTKKELDTLFLEVSSTDNLTGWPIRREFEEEIEQVLHEETPFSLLYIGLDNFKHINTLYNHKTGDEVIKSIAKSLEKLLGPEDLVARLDGDELILLRLNQKDEQITDFFERVVNIFTNPVVLIDLRLVTVNASIGVSSYPQDSYSAEELIAFAETAMRTAKKQHGSSYSLFHSGMGIDLARRLMIEKSLAGNLQELGFHFVVQPQINCETGGLTGIEVLSRWNHPTLGPISPVEFINVAEETGTISRLTNHLMKEVFSFVNDQKKNYGSFPKTAINVTSSLVSSKEFFDDLFAQMKNYHISPEQIELEITESVELTSSELTLSNLMACRSKGISIALDDFGTGFSMLAYLMDYPIDKIKLDKSFVAKIGQDAKSEAVLISLIQFVRGIDCELLAEGVETVEESSFLQKNGCPVHQGYLYDKPMSLKDFDRKYLNGSY